MSQRSAILRRLTPRRVARKVWRTLYRKDYELYRGLRLPRKDLRGVMCGEAFCSNEFFHQSGIVEARRLVARLGYRPAAKVADIGSGLGRLATGMIWEFGEDVNYVGIEVRPEFVQWCQRHITTYHPKYTFVHADIVNERYNPHGSQRGAESIRLPLTDADVDIAYLWGVFTNMGPEEVLIYISELGRILRPGGRAFLTVFAEPDAPEVSFNPPGYGPYEHDGSPLLVVRYNYQFLVAALARQGLQVDEFRHHGGGFPYQSEMYLTKLR
jgi:SAM-dependent methyltransferase